MQESAPLKQLRGTSSLDLREHMAKQGEQRKTAGARVRRMGRAGILYCGQECLDRLLGWQRDSHGIGCGRRCHFMYANIRWFRHSERCVRIAALGANKLLC